MDPKIIKDNYEKTYWVDNETVVDARKLNKLERQLEIVTGDLIMQNEINSSVQDKFDDYYNITIIDQKFKEVQKGTKGDKGDPGERGPQGLTGQRGPQGYPGEKGDPGRDGEQGPKGNTGPVGPAGPRGEVGPQGPKGEDGKSIQILGSKDSTDSLPESSDIGDGYLVSGDLHVWNGQSWENVGRVQGPAGPKGEPGKTGAKGDAGETPNITIGKVTLLNSDQAPTVTRRGENNAPIFDFGIPKGATGEKGEPGAKGATGETGQQGPIGLTPNITIGEVTTIKPEEKATVTRRGSNETPVFDFKIPQGKTGTVDYSLVYTKDDADDRFALKSEINSGIIDLKVGGYNYVKNSYRGVIIKANK